MPALPVTVVTATGNMTLPVIISTFLNISDVRNNPTLTKMDKTLWVAGMYFTVLGFIMNALFIGHLILKCHRHYHPRYPRRPDRAFEELQIQQIKDRLENDYRVDPSLDNKLSGEDARCLVFDEKHGHDEKSFSTSSTVQDEPFHDSFSGHSGKLIDAPIIEHGPGIHDSTPKEEDLQSKQNEGSDVEHYLAPLSHEFDHCANCHERQKSHVNKMKEVVWSDSAAKLPGRFEYNQDGFLFHPDNPSVTDHERVTYELNGFHLVRCDYIFPRAEHERHKKSFEEWESEWLSSRIDTLAKDIGCDSRVQLEQNLVIHPYGFSFFGDDSVQFVNDKAKQALQTGDGRQLSDLMAEFHTWVREDVVSWNCATHCAPHAKHWVCLSCGLDFQEPNPIPRFLLLPEGGKSSGSDQRRDLVACGCHAEPAGCELQVEAVAEAVM
ncbi:MAG: hypothetical protein Q9208_003548 [Pyrenodesmia sp. 3 TL-2023]